jgi:hypothetical protein
MYITGYNSLFIYIFMYNNKAIRSNKFEIKLKKEMDILKLKAWKYR